MIKSAAELIAAAALRSELVDVNGLQLRLRELSVADRGRLVQHAASSPATQAAVLVQMSAVNPDGALLFGETELDAICALRPDVVKAIADHVMRISGLQEKPGKD